jgi:DNA-binding beta-propeller fold protein YncE
MTWRASIWIVFLGLATAGAAEAAPTRSSPLGVAADGHVFVVNPDSNTVARLEFDANHAGTLTHEAPVGRYPRTLALAGPYVFTADQNADTVSRLDQADLGNRLQANLGFGCTPYGLAATPSGEGVLATCQGTSELVLLDAGLTVIARVKLLWPNARAIAVSDAGRAYVTHFLTEEPGTEAHVSVVDLAQKSVATVFAIPADTITCETQNSGQGPLNLLSAIAIVPGGALGGQIWVGGTQENNISKGLFKRFPDFQGQPGSQLFPLITFTPFPEAVPPPSKKRRKKQPKPEPVRGAMSRNKYKASFHDITRFGIYKLDGGDGHVVGKLDIDEANNATDIEFSTDGGVAYVVDHMFNSIHIFNTRKGQDGDVTTLFAAPSSFGAGGADASRPCISDALNSVTGEARFRMAPQSQITTIDGYNPVRYDPSEPDPAKQYTVANTGLDFDTATYMSTGASQMRPVPDGIGTAPFGVRLAPDGQAVYVANYLARNVVVAASAQPTDPASGKPVNLRCSADVREACSTNNDCPPGAGFCNHPGGPSCATDADCGNAGPCLHNSDCVPLLFGEPVLSIKRQADNPGCVANGRINVDATPVAVCDPVYPAVLDGKNLFNTAARDSSVPNQIGLGQNAPLFNDASRTGKLPGSVVSTSHDASYVTCSTCHADFGGQDGRTWDFSQLGPSLRNTMDLRGRAGFAPGHCSNDGSIECFFDAACGDGNFCRMREDQIPANIPAADRGRYFNPMLTIHWNGDRDEVEDFEHTYRSLMGAGDCDGFEDVNIFDPTNGARGCLGALIQRNPATSSDPVDVNDDLGAPNRNLAGHADPSKIVGIRLSHMADFVYSLTEFVKNPNAPDAAAERGRLLFNDPQTKCAQCHNSAPLTGGRQFFTDKRVRTAQEGFDPDSPAGADRNNPFLRNNVGTANLFDATDPMQVAIKTGSFTNANVPIPGPRGTLGDYITPVLNDVWNTAPYLHDGSAPFLLDVIRACDSTLDDCPVFGRGRNIDDKHGVTSILTPQQLNDLTAFQKTLTLGTKVGTGDQVVFAGTLTLNRARLAFPKRGGGSFAIDGTLSAPPGPLDLGAGVTVSLAMPDGEEMAIFSRPMPMKAKGKGFAGRVRGSDGTTVVKLRALAGGRMRLTASGKETGVGVLDTGNRILTVALEVKLANSTAEANFVKTRNVQGKTRVFQLARRGKS